MPPVATPATHESSPTPGRWFVRLQHTAIGGIDFSCVTKPTITKALGGACFSLTIDENFYLLPVEGLKLLWLLYVPRDGEALLMADAVIQSPE